MVGKVGMKGGGGARDGAGRPPKEKTYIQTSGNQTSLEFLKVVMNDNTIDVPTRVSAAKTVAQYENAKQGNKGVKGAKQDAAQEAAKGKFSASAPPKAPKPPKLKVVNGR